MKSRIEELGAPSSEFNEGFVEGMRTRMAVSYHKYGRVADGADAGIDWIACLRTRLDRYEETGNTEWLEDVGNFAMIEFTYPQHPNAHYRPTDSDESPGRTHPSKTVMGETTRSDATHNLDIRS